MNLIQIIMLILGFFSIAGFVLCIVGFSTRIPLMEKIAKPFILPSILALAVILLYPYLPDSRNVMRNAIPAISLGLAAIILLDYVKSLRFEKIFAFLSCVMLFIQKLFWINLLYRSIQLYPRMTGFNVLITIIYVLIAAFLFIVRLYPERILTGIFTAIYAAATFFLNYITLVTLCGTISFYSIFFFIGSIVMIGADFMCLIYACGKDFEGAPLIKDILYFSSQILMALGAVSMMIF